MLFLISSCAFTPANGPESLKKEFHKICLSGSGKGRIEVAGSKYVFNYESQFNPRKSTFDLSLDFPIIGETLVSLSLVPRLVSKQIGGTQLVAILREKIGDRADRDQIIKAIEEFFVFSSDFLRHVESGEYPKYYEASLNNEHFLLTRQTTHYKFEIDNFSENETYFERVVFRIYLKSSTPTGTATDPTMTLFLVPQTCDSKSLDAL